MKSRDFVIRLCSYYREPLIIEGKPNVRVVILESWLKTISEDNLDSMFDRIVFKFVPTSINPFPLIPHIVDICEIVTPEKSKQELARAVSDRIIWAILNIGCREEGSRDKAIKYIGELGIRVIKSAYGKWRFICEEAENNSLEFLRSHLRDSALTFISRSEKGIEEEEPKLEDLKKPVRQSFLSLNGEGKVCLPENKGESCRI